MKMNEQKFAFEKLEIWHISMEIIREIYKMEQRYINEDAMEKLRELLKEKYYSTF